MFINLENGIKKYGDGAAEVLALNNVDMGINHGEIAVVLGPSGSGKSTLLNMVGGLDRLDSGYLSVGDKEISKMNQKQLTEYRRSDIGFVFQFYNLIQDLTVKENVEAVAALSKIALNVDEVLETLEIGELKYRFPKELSGGQQQRVAIARAIVKKPSLLLCDELTGALDSKSAHTVLRFIERVNKKYGTTIVIITHNEIIQGMADRVIKMKDGKIHRDILNDNKVKVEDMIL